MSDDVQKQLDAYRLLLRALLLLHGGTFKVEPGDMPGHSFSIYWRFTPDGGVEAIMQDTPSSLLPI